MKPTRRAILLFAATIPLSLAVVLANDSLWPFGFVLLAAAIFLTGLDGIRALSPRALEVETHTPGVLYAGGSDDLQVTLRAATRAAPASIEMLCDVSANLHMPPNRQVTLTGDGLGRTSAPLTPMRRGAANVERLWLRWRGPMGLMERLRVEELALEIPVVPNVRAVRNAAIRFTAWDAPTGIKPQNQQGDGSEFESLRDYVPGLDHRSIDWKHSARHRELVCKEFRAERNHQIIMAIDTGHLMSEPMDGIPKLDHAINNALVLGYACLRHGDRIGIFGFDSQTRLYAEPVGGMHYYNHFLRTSAKIEYRPDETNFTLGLTELTMRLTQRSLIILQTEFVDTTTAELMLENLARLASRHVVLFVALRDPDIDRTVDAPPRTLEDVTRSVIAEDFARERLVVFERLRRLGVQCLEAPSDKMGTELVDRYLAIKNRELV
jgi:uncharacterized protein (DUF58 family)